MIAEFLLWRSQCIVAKNEFIAIYFVMSLHTIISGKNEREIGNKTEEERGGRGRENRLQNYRELQENK